MKKIFMLLLIIIFPLQVKAINISATSAILMDTDNQRIIYSKNIHEQRSVASISKIMTAIIALESEKTDEIVEVGNIIKQAYGSAIYLQENEKIKLIDLVYGLMLRSGNDAALVIADFLGPGVDKFVEKMNDKAQQIGMRNTIYNNPNGLDDKGGNLSTAYDMALLTSYAMHNDEYRQIVSTKNHQVKTNKNTYSWTNKHKLLNLYKYTTGGKTGYTDIAKRTLVTTASKDGINLVAVTLNDGNDFADHIELFDYGFSNYTNYQILKRGYVKIYDNNYKNYKFYINNDFSYIVSDQEKDNLKIKFKLDNNKNIKENNQIGYVEVYLDNHKIYETKLYGELDQKTNNNFFSKFKKWMNSLW